MTECVLHIVYVYEYTYKWNYRIAVLLYASSGPFEYVVIVFAVHIERCWGVAAICIVERVSPRRVASSGGYNITRCY